MNRRSVITMRLIMFLEHPHLRDSCFLRKYFLNGKSCLQKRHSLSLTQKSLVRLCPKGQTTWTVLFDCVLSSDFPCRFALCHSLQELTDCQVMPAIPPQVWALFCFVLANGLQICRTFSTLSSPSRSRLPCVTFHDMDF